MNGGTTNVFAPMPVRVAGELDERIELGKKALHYHNTFLDDYLRGILPHDLILIGAPSGMGKTDLALSIAASNAMNKKRVAFFALEAEPRELERRTKYKLLASMVRADRHARADEMNYTDWLMGACETICGDFNRRADQMILESLSGLQTFYRGTKFDQHDLEDAVLAIYEHIDLIVIDHLHYIDLTGDGDELGDTVKTIRDVALLIGRPVILIAHLRKRDTRGKQIVAGQDDFHGSSNIVKICTQAITIERATSIEPSKWYLSPTFVNIPKDRRSGACPLVAVMQFDKRTGSYIPQYTLGRVIKGGSEWEQIDDKPRWAKHHVQIHQEAG